MEYIHHSSELKKIAYKISSHDNVGSISDFWKKRKLSQEVKLHRLLTNKEHSR